MKNFRSVHLIAARVIARSAYYTPTNKEIVLARKMAGAGATLQQVHDALGWNCCLGATKNRLLKFNIKPGHPRAHKGYETSIPHDGGTDARPYRPRGAA